jgi:hypothetical protein
MTREELIQHIESLARVATASDDEVVRKSGAVLLTLKGTLIAGDDFCEAFFDNMSILNKNMANATMTALRQQDS